MPRRLPARNGLLLKMYRFPSAFCSMA
jgi:hypothetical protein